MRAERAQAFPPWPRPRVELAPIEARVGRLYRAERPPYGAVRARLLHATDDVRFLLAELRKAWAASDGFLEAIGRGILTVSKTPTGRRKLRELAAEAIARRQREAAAR
jgi:hypothetical protein